MTRPICALLLIIASLPDALAQSLDAPFLLGPDPFSTPASTTDYAPPPGALPGHPFAGVLELVPPPGHGQIAVLTDWFDYANDNALAIADLPPFRFEFVQHGTELIPVLRGPQPSSHPHWEFILEPGTSWAEGDDGWNRAALPFALQERNANCTHNGLMTFLYRNDGSISRVAYQVGSETCQYFQADLWGVLPARYLPGKVEQSDRIILEYRAERDARLPVRPLADIAALGDGVNVDNFNTLPAGEVSAVGFVMEGVHYRGGCSTRYGPYPFCDVLDLPSYSLAKSIAAALAWMILEQETPGIGNSAVASYIPQCRDSRWDGVTLQHLLNMTSGNFSSRDHNIDEYASYETDFMDGDTHLQKVEVACTLFPRKAEPGTTFTYHTSDTYLGGVLMSGVLAEQAALPQGIPRDLHRNVLYDKLYGPLGLSPVLRDTRRTYDDLAQPFIGFGLTLHSDDIARLGAFLLAGNGQVEGAQVLDPRLLNAALQKDPDKPGISAGSAELRYNNGFWAYRIDLGGVCSEPLWIPFMSGYGGISVALLPNDSVYYVFSDHGRFEWITAAIESNKIKPFCGIK